MTIPLKHEFKVGDEAKVLQLGWEGEGTPQSPLRKVDVIGKITSIKGITPNHNSKYKYQFSYKSGTYCTDGEDLLTVRSDKLKKIQNEISHKRNRRS